MFEKEGALHRLFTRIRIPVILLFLPAAILSVLSIRRL
jgi:hypothetical protein